jgi:hypothetical protein
MRTLVITPCSEEKHGELPTPGGATELAGNVPDPGQPSQVVEYPLETRLLAYARPAAEMFTNEHHRLVMEGVRSVWDRWGRWVLDLAILSGGYGLLQADEVIVPYDLSFDELDTGALQDLVAYLKVPERAASLVRAYDLVFYLLSGRYLSVLGLPLHLPDSVQQIVLTAQDSLALVPVLPNLHPVVADGPVAARRWHVKAPYVRGFLFGRLCKQVVRHGPAVLEWLYHRPDDTDPLLYKRACWRPQWDLWQV